MAGEYLLPPNFRPETPAAACRNLTLVEELAPTDELAEEIEAASRRVDDICDDRFSPLTGQTVVVDVADSWSRLDLPYRFTAITSVSTRDDLGALTLQLATAYRWHRSLNATGTAVLQDGDRDYIDILLGSDGLVVSSLLDPWSWPVGTQAVQIVGDYGWTVTPFDIKRVVAMLCWDHFQRENGEIRRAKRWAVDGLTVERDVDSLTGLPEADKLLRRFRPGAGDVVPVLI